MNLEWYEMKALDLTLEIINNLMEDMREEYAEHVCTETGEVITTNGLKYVKNIISNLMDMNGSDWEYVTFEER